MKEYAQRIKEFIGERQWLVQIHQIVNQGSTLMMVNPQNPKQVYVLTHEDDFETVVMDVSEAMNAQNA